MHVNWKKEMTEQVQQPARGAAIFYSKFRHGNTTEATLLECKMCELRVHDVCYGAKIVGNQSLWECDLCRGDEKRKVNN